jgi:hypothetical protein
MTQDERDWQLLNVSQSVGYIWDNVTKEEAATLILQILGEFRADPERVAAAREALREAGSERYDAWRKKISDSMIRKYQDGMWLLTRGKVSYYKFRIVDRILGILLLAGWDYRTFLWLSFLGVDPNSILTDNKTPKSLREEGQYLQGWIIEYLYEGIIRKYLPDFAIAYSASADWYFQCFTGINCYPNEANSPAVINEVKCMLGSLGRRELRKDIFKWFGVVQQDYIMLVQFWGNNSTLTVRVHHLKEPNFKAVFEIMSFMAWTTESTDEHIEMDQARTPAAEKAYTAKSLNGAFDYFDKGIRFLMILQDELRTLPGCESIVLFKGLTQGGSFRNVIPELKQHVLYYGKRHQGVIVNGRWQLFSFVTNDNGYFTEGLKIVPNSSIDPNAFTDNKLALVSNNGFSQVHGKHFVPCRSRKQVPEFLKTKLTKEKYDAFELEMKTYTNKAKGREAKDESLEDPIIAVVENVIEATEQDLDSMLHHEDREEEPGGVVLDQGGAEEDPEVVLEQIIHNSLGSQEGEDNPKGDSLAEVKSAAKEKPKAAAAISKKAFTQTQAKGGSGPIDKFFPLRR